jgi:hypothetical protein
VRLATVYFTTVAHKKAKPNEQVAWANEKLGSPNQGQSNVGYNTDRMLRLGAATLSGEAIHGE